MSGVVEGDDPGAIGGHLDAPFQYFGRKAYAAPRVWEILEAK